MKITIIYDSIYGSTLNVCNFIEEGIRKVDGKIETEIKRIDEVQIDDDADFFVVAVPMYGGIPLPSLYDFIFDFRRRWSDILALIVIHAPFYDEINTKHYIFRIFQSTNGFNPLVKRFVGGVINIEKLTENKVKYLETKFKYGLNRDEKIIGEIDANLCFDISTEIIDTINMKEEAEENMLALVKNGIEIYFRSRFNKEASHDKDISIEFDFEDLDFKYFLEVKDGNLNFLEKYEGAGIILKSTSQSFNLIGLEFSDGTDLRITGDLEIEGDENLLLELYNIFSIT